MNDEAMAARAARGDRDALCSLAERYRGYIYAIAWKIALHEEDAFDITQNVLMRLVEKIDRFNGRGRFRAWVASIAARESINYLRKAPHRETPTDPATLAEAVEKGAAAGAPASPRKQASEAERRRHVEAAMQHLSSQQRAILTLRLKEQMTPKEIGEQLGIPGRQVRSQLHRAIGRVRDVLKKQGVL